MKLLSECNDQNDPPLKGKIQILFIIDSLLSWAVPCFPSQYKAYYIVQDRLKHPDTIDFYGSRVIWAQWNIFPCWCSDVNGAQIDCKQGGKAAYVKLYRIVYETSRASKLEDEHPGSNPADAILFFCHHFPFNAVYIEWKSFHLQSIYSRKKAAGNVCLVNYYVVFIRKQFMAPNAKATCLKS